MARSEYIYVVVHSMHWNGEVLGVFTVKREMMSWLREQKWTEGGRIGKEVYRHRDACPGYEPVDITDEIRSELNGPA